MYNYVKIINKPLPIAQNDLPVKDAPLLGLTLNQHLFMIQTIFCCKKNILHALKLICNRTLLSTFNIITRLLLKCCH